MSRPIATVSLMDPALEGALGRELRDGEKLVWSGQPHPWMAARQMLPVMCFGLLFGGFAVFWIAGAAAAAWNVPRPSGAAASSGMDWIKLLFPLFGLPFLLIGLGMVLSPLGARRKASRTVYALTDRRVIIMSGRYAGGREVRSFAPEELGNMRRRERRNGSGDLLFAERLTVNRESGSNATMYAAPQSGFFAVSAVAELERLVRHTLKLD